MSVRWVATIDEQPHLEYGLWKTRAQALQAARDIAFVRCKTPDAAAGALRVYYKIVRGKKRPQRAGEKAVMRDTGTTPAQGE